MRSSSTHLSIMVLKSKTAVINLAAHLIGKELLHKMTWKLFNAKWLNKKKKKNEYGSNSYYRFEIKSGPNEPRLIRILTSVTAQGQKYIQSYIQAHIWIHNRRRKTLQMFELRNWTIFSVQTFHLDIQSHIYHCVWTVHKGLAFWETNVPHLCVTTLAV